MNRILIAIGYGIVAAILTYLVGLILKEVALEPANFLMTIAPLVGILAGGAYLLAGKRPL